MRILLLLLLLPLFTIAQDIKKNAIAVENLNDKSGNRNLILEKLENRLTRSKINLYKWNPANSTVEPFGTTIGKEEPINLLTYLTFQVSDDPKSYPLQIKTDTSGKTTEVFFVSSPSLAFTTKTVEVLTNRIVDVVKTAYTVNNRTSTEGVIYVKDFIQEFGGDPNQLKKTNFKEFEKKEKAVINKYLPIIQKFNTNSYTNYASRMMTEVIKWKDESSTKAFEVIRNVEDEKKIKYVSFSKSPKDSLLIEEPLTMYQILSWGNIKTTREVQNFYVSKIEPTLVTTEVQAFSNKKKIAEAMKDNSLPLVMLKSDRAVQLYNKQLNKIQDQHYSAVKKNCLFCNVDLEKSLLQVPSIYLLERNAPETKYFQELLKKEEFIDYSETDLLNKQLGVKFLFYSEDGQIMATDIETGKIFSNNSNKDKFITLRETDATRVKMTITDIFNKNINILEVTDQSKNKIKEILLYSELGFFPTERVKYYINETETVGGKKINRKKYIGIIKITKSISDFVGVGEVSTGDKEMFKLLEDKTEIFFEYTTDKNI